MLSAPAPPAPSEARPPLAGKTGALFHLPVFVTAVGAALFLLSHETLATRTAAMAMIALAVAIVTFGLLGSTTTVSKVGMQIGGAAAGFLVVLASLLTTLNHGPTPEAERYVGAWKDDDGRRMVISAQKESLLIEVAGGFGDYVATGAAGHGLVALRGYGVARGGSAMRPDVKLRVTSADTLQLKPDYIVRTADGTWQDFKTDEWITMVRID